MQQTPFRIFFFVLLFALSIKTQQQYSGNSVLDCDHQSTAPPSPFYLYTCNGPSLSCQAFLIFKSQPYFDSVDSISSLLNSDPLGLARINVSDSYTFPTNKEVIIPVNCSCSGQYYQANTSYVIDNNDTYSGLAIDQYQGLSSCSALIGENPYKAENLSAGVALLVPLRCACPTKNQIKDGTKYLLTYRLSEGDNLSDLSERFNASDHKTTAANGFTEQDLVVYPSTTLLIPLPRETLSSQTIIYHPTEYTPPPPPFPVIPAAKRSNTKLYAGIAAGVVSILVLFLLVTVFLWLHRKNMKIIKGKKQCVLPKYILEAVSGIDHTLTVYRKKNLRQLLKISARSAGYKGQFIGEQWVEACLPSRK